METYKFAKGGTYTFAWDQNLPGFRPYPNPLKGTYALREGGKIRLESEAFAGQPTISPVVVEEDAEVSERSWHGDCAMSSMNYDHSATREYLTVVRQHVIHPLEMTAVADSCFAAAMLIFGSADAIGKLIYPDDDASATKRFKHFLPRLGPAYATLEDELWKLRNALAHSSMNVACFMSKTEDALGEHLETDRGSVFIHTRRLLEDFKAAIDKLESDFITDATLLQRAENRLEWDSIGQHGWRGNRVMTTPPPGIRFVKER